MLKKINGAYLQISIATADDVKEMQHMLKNEFLPEEPVSMNSPLTKSFMEGENPGWIHRKLEAYIDNEMITGSFENNVIKLSSYFTKT